MAELWDIYDKNRVKTGGLVERGQPLKDNEYFLAVHIWVQNSKGEWLISKRTPNKHYPNKWEPTGGAAVTGDDSLTAALRETKEELGIDLDPKQGVMWKSYHKKTQFYNQILDVWLFKHDCPIESVVLQEFETCDAMWATPKKIYEMLESGEFVEKSVFSYIDEILSL